MLTDSLNTIFVLANRSKLLFTPSKSDMYVQFPHFPEVKSDELEAVHKINIILELKNARVLGLFLSFFEFNGRKMRV